MLKGSCLCGGVSFTVSGDVPGPSVCHCGQCRKQSGHVWSSSYAPVEQIEIAGQGLKWFRASDTAKRGFCGTCGSFLFWKQDDENTMSFAMGALDGDTGLRLSKHIFTRDKGDYYEIADDAPKAS